MDRVTISTNELIQRRKQPLTIGLLPGWLDVEAINSKSLISSGYGATVLICDLSKEKISFQNKFSGWADVFQNPRQHKYVDVRAQCRAQGKIPPQLTLLPVFFCHKIALLRSDLLLKLSVNSFVRGTCALQKDLRNSPITLNVHPHFRICSASPTGLAPANPPCV